MVKIKNNRNRLFIPKAPPNNVGQLTLDDYLVNEEVLYNNMASGFDEAVNATLEWFKNPDTADFFAKRNGRLSEFFTESGIRDEWASIVEARASRGVNLTEQIFNYARKVNMADYLEPYTRAEKLALNKLCDYNYELITNVTTEQISGIRRHLIQDYAEGVNPRQTSLKDELTQIQLEPVNYLSPVERAEMIARTESARALNTSTLETYRADGITHVVLYNPDQCDECAQYADESDPVPVEEAVEIGVVHPNCRCTWIPVTEVQ